MPFGTLRIAKSLMQKEKMRLLLIITFLGISIQGQCDFVDYWKIMVNDSVIYDSRNDKEAWTHSYKLNLPELNLEGTDTISLQYITDTPCPNCDYNLLFTDTAKNKKGVLTINGRDELNRTRMMSIDSFGKFKLSVSQLEEITKSTFTEVYYYKTDTGNMFKILEIEKKH